MKLVKNKKEILLNFLVKSFKSIFGFRRNDQFNPSWKAIKSESINENIFKVKHRIIESSQSPSFKLIKIRENKSKIISEDLYPLR